MTFTSPSPSPSSAAAADAGLGERGVGGPGVGGPGASGPGAGTGGPADADASACVVDALAAANRAILETPQNFEAFAPLSDAELLEANSLLAELRDHVAARAVLVAGEIARRSVPRLGSAGLAQRAGFRTPIEMVKVTTRATGRDASRAVQVGTLMVETASEGQVDLATGEIVTSSKPWLRCVAVALEAQRLSVAAAEAIASGLGVPTSGVTADQLADAAQVLCRMGGVLDPDRLFRRAREARDELDAAGIALREEERFLQRSFTLTVLPNGMGRAVWVMDPETLASTKDLYDRATSPKLGGVRFASPGSQARADEILADSRSVAQLASDAMAQLIALGAAADPRFLMSSGAPIVKVIVTETALSAHAGHGRIEGQPDPVSIRTIERLACSGGVVGVLFDEQGQPLDVGREQRVFTRRQKSALAVRDGGCMAPNCDRPPSFCEAHHIEQWSRDRGKTDISNGILLCRHHHLLFHNNGWQIERDVANTYWLIPPDDVDPAQRPVEMPSKSAAMRDWRRERERARSA